MSHTFGDGQNIWVPGGGKRPFLLPSCIDGARATVRDALIGIPESELAAYKEQPAHDDSADKLEVLPPGHSFSPDDH
jgi:hypothetical protein